MNACGSGYCNGTLAMAEMKETVFVERLLKRYGLRTRKGLGQHLLANTVMLERIAAATEADASADIVEIGAGIGNLTSALLDTGAASVTSIEIDPRFTPVHKSLLTSKPGAAERARFVYVDALEFDYAAAARESRTAGRRFLIAGNIPYQITSPLIMKILESDTEFDSMTLLVQREVGQRLAAAPGSRRNGAISIKVQYYCTVRALFDVPSSMFVPPPEVQSVVVQFTRMPRGDAEQRRKLFRLVEAAFAQRRKMLPNSVAATGVGYSRAEVEDALIRAGLHPQVRAECLGLPEFVALLDQLK